MALHYLLSQRLPVPNFFQEADNQDFSEEMADPEFLRNVLGSLPNVDPDSEAVKAAIGQTTQQSSSKSGN